MKLELLFEPDIVHLLATEGWWFELFEVDLGIIIKLAFDVSPECVSNLLSSAPLCGGGVGGNV